MEEKEATAPQVAPGDPKAFVGTVLDGRYRVEAWLSAGGMGDVYRADQVSLGRKVAIKLLRAHLNQVQEMDSRFSHEAQVLSKLDHPNIVRVIDFNSTAERSYLVMELVEGPTLHKVLAELGRMDPHRTVAILSALCDALTAAHGVGIIHRDLKPENVVLTGAAQDVPKILDFGIARLQSVKGDTREGMVIGTPEYLSPEQAMGRPLDLRSDLYSLSVVAFRMLVGRLPFEGSEVREILLAHVNAPPPDMASLAPHLSACPALCAVVQRGLSKEPSDRFETAAELKAALKAGLEGRPPPGTPPTPSALMKGATLPPQGSRSFAIAARTQNLAIMFTAMEGFSERTSSQSREENARMLAVHDGLVLPVVKGFRGRKIKSIGDVQLVTFQSPTDSVLCGMALQDRLWEFNRTHAEAERIEVRVAVGLGEVRLEAGDVYGEPVNIASRIEKLAKGGEVLFNDAVYLAMNKSEVPTEDGGLHDLKGISEPVRVYRVKRGEPSGLAPPYGGVQLASLGVLPVASERGAVSRLQQAAVGAVAATRTYGLRAGIAGLLGLGLFFGGTELLRRFSDPLAVADRAVDGKQYTAALAELERAPKGSDKLAAFHLVKGKALQGLQKRELAMAELATALQLAPGSVDAGLVTALVDDLDSDTFADAQRPKVIKLLGESVGARAEKPLRVLVSSGRGRTRRDALEALELMGKAQDGDRFVVASGDLAEKTAPCSAKQRAVQRLGSIGDERSAKLLGEVQDFGRCPLQQAAQDALRKIVRTRAAK